MSYNEDIREVNEKLNLMLSLFSIKEDGKEKTLLEKYNETKILNAKYVMSNSKIDYIDMLNKTVQDLFEKGDTPKTDSDGYFEYDGRVYNIKDYNK